MMVALVLILFLLSILGEFISMDDKFQEKMKQEIEELDKK